MNKEKQKPLTSPAPARARLELKGDGRTHKRKARHSSIRWSGDVNQILEAEESKTGRPRAEVVHELIKYADLMRRMHGRGVAK